MWVKSVLCFVLLLGAVYCLPESRVVNGTDSDIHRFPFMISLRGKTNEHICGGSIIDPYWILTAAHCVYGINPETINIQYAVTHIDSNGPNIGIVRKIFIHEKYNIDNEKANDIALLKLKGRFVVNYRTIGLVSLPQSLFETPQTSEGAPGILIGWGLNETGGTIQKHLQEVNLNIFSDKECQQIHNNVTENQICSGVDEGGKGQCIGDSGGPLLFNRTMVVGIVSWSIKPCCSSPGVYTKVSHYIIWIRETMLRNN